MGNDGESKKKQKHEKHGKLLFISITIWMYVVLVLFLVATIVICIRGLMDYGFTLDSIPNFILIIALLIVSIIIVFAVTTERKPFIMPLIGLLIALAVLTFIVFFFRIYVFARDGGQGHPWDFNFEVKFYPPDPTTLNDDITRHLLSLQVRHDISTAKLPATLVTHALLGSYVAQSVRGDYEPSIQYIDFLRSYRLAPVPSETLYEKVEELHKQHRGVTPGEADMHYLDNAKKLSMYGVHLFPAKDGKGVPVQVGVYAHGINVYRDQIRVHRFLWQNIIKIAYRRNVFIVKVKSGELEKNESSAAFKLPDYDAAKRVWKCAVEHHTFFRLIQPEEKTHKGLFRWGSAKFRYQGRTQFQSKMASQMFSNQPVQHSQSTRLVRNDNVVVSKNQTLPVNYAEDGTSKESEWNSSQPSSPEKTYTIRVVETPQRRENDALRNGAEVGNNSRDAYLGGSSGKLHNDNRCPAIATAATTTATATTISAAATTTTSTTTTTTTATTTTTTTTTGQSFGQETSAVFSSLHFSPQDLHDTALSTERLSDNGLYYRPRYVSSDKSCSGPNISDLQKEKDIRFLPIQDTAVVYHPGHYEEEAAAYHNGPLREPPFELGDDFVLVHRPKLGATGKIFHESGSETDILVKEDEIEAHPVRYFVNIYHSGFSRLNGGNRDFDVFEREKCVGSDDIVDQRKVDKKKYPKDENIEGPILRTEPSLEMPTEPLRSHAYVHNQSFYDITEPGAASVDEKGNRYWLRGYTKCGKLEKKPSEIRDQELQRRMDFDLEKDGTKLVNGSNTVGGFISQAERKDESKKTALIYLRQPCESQTLASDNRAEVMKEKFHSMADYEQTKMVVADVDARDSCTSEVTTNAVDSVRLKQAVHLYAFTAHDVNDESAEKGRIGPGAYGLPSTSYEGPLHSMKRDVELLFSPIYEHAAVYHFGFSDVKDKKRRKLAVRKESQKGTLPGTSSDDEVTDARQKNTAILHLRDRKNETVVAAGMEENSIGEEMIVKYKKHEVGGTCGTESKENGVQLTGTASLGNEGVCPVSSDIKTQAGTIVKGASIPKETVHARVPKYDVLACSKSMKESGKVKPLVPPRKPLDEYAEDNTPPVETLGRTDEITFQPLHLILKDTSYQMRSQPYNYKTFKRAKHEGSVEFITKENLDQKSYKLGSAAYPGPLDNTVRKNELQFSPIQEHSTIYHPGNSYVKSRQAHKWKNVPKFQETWDVGTPGIKKTALLHLKNADFSDRSVTDQKERVSSGSFSKWRTEGVSTQNTHGSHGQHANYKAKIITKVSEKMDRSSVHLGARNHPFKYRTHVGDVEIIEKLHIKPETYMLCPTPYEGPLNHLECRSELAFAPLLNHSAVYHSGISYLKAKRVRNSSSESSSSSVSSSSSSGSRSSSSRSNVIVKFPESKKKAILHIYPDGVPANDISTDVVRIEGLRSFWRGSSRDEEDYRLPDVDKKPETPPKPLLGEKHTFSGGFISSHGLSPCSLKVSTTSLKGSESEIRSEISQESEHTKVSARIYFKDAPSEDLESTEDPLKLGKFSPFPFWRSAEEKSKIETEKLGSFAPTGNLKEESRPSPHMTDERTIDSSNSGSKKKAVEKGAVKSPKPLHLSEDMKEDSLKSVSKHCNVSDFSNINAKKGALIHLRDSSRLRESKPSNFQSTFDDRQEITAVTFTQRADRACDDARMDHTSPMEEVPYQPLRVKISVQHEKSGLVEEAKHDTDMPTSEMDGAVAKTGSVGDSGQSEDKGYRARMAIQPQASKSESFLQKETKIELRTAKSSEENSMTSSNFRLIGIHLRGPPSDSEEAIKMAICDIPKHKCMESNHEPVSAKGIEVVTVAGKDRAEQLSSAEGTEADKKVSTLRIRDEKLVESEASYGKESKKVQTKGSGGGGFFSFWRGSKLRSRDDQHKLKLAQDEIHETGTTGLETTSPSNELQYKTLLAKIDVYNAGYKKEEPVPGVVGAEKQSKQPFVPVYDFSYVPSFGDEVTSSEVGRDSGKKTALLIQEKEITGGTKSNGREAPWKVNEAKGWGENAFRRLFGLRSKEMEEFYDAPSAWEDEVADQEHNQPSFRLVQPSEKAFLSELSWEKSDAPKLDQPGELNGQKTPENEERPVVYLDATSGEEISDEPYKFTQTPPDVPTPVVQIAAKGPRSFVEHFKRQVTQVVAKASPSSEKKKKFKKEKKRSKKDASSRGSESSSASETESAFHHDSSSFTHSKGSTSKPEVFGTLPYEEAKLDEGHVLFEKSIDETFHLKGTEASPVVDPANPTDSSPHKTVDAWHETTTGPETLVTSVDHQGNVIKRTIKTQQVKHTVQRQTYQTYGVLDQNGDSGMHVVETTQKSIIPVGDKAVVNTQTPIVETRSHALAYESLKGEPGVTNENDYADIPGELVSSRTITQGNRTIETITYKTEKNGVIETHVEHRVTIHSGENIDHDAELSQAILEATNMNPDMTVEKIEVKQESQC